MGDRLSVNKTDAEAAIILGNLRIIDRRLRRLEAATDLVSAACRYCDAQSGDDCLNSGQLWFELERARDNYRRALRALDDEDEVDA
jgi:hypothetical protein